jgi:hypothetical protein
VSEQCQPNSEENATQIKMMKSHTPSAVIKQSRGASDTFSIMLKIMAEKKKRSKMASSKVGA